MPCRDDANERTTLEEFRDRINARTAMLCELCEECERDPDFVIPEKIYKWWKQHQEQDRLRKLNAPRVAYGVKNAV